MEITLFRPTRSKHFSHRPVDLSILDRNLLTRPGLTGLGRATRWLVIENKIASEICTLHADGPQ